MVLSASERPTTFAEVLCRLPAACAPMVGKKSARADLTPERACSSRAIAASIDWLESVARRSSADNCGSANTCHQSPRSCRSAAPRQPSRPEATRARQIRLPEAAFRNDVSGLAHAARQCNHTEDQHAESKHGRPLRQYARGLPMRRHLSGLQPPARRPPGPASLQQWFQSRGPA